MDFYGVESSIGAAQVRDSAGISDECVIDADRAERCGVNARPVARARNVLGWAPIVVVVRVEGSASAEAVVHSRGENDCVASGPLRDQLGADLRLDLRSL